MEQADELAAQGVAKAVAKARQTELGAPTIGAHRQALNLNCITEQHIEELWVRMVMVFGGKWPREYGDRDDGTWLAALRSKTPEQLAAGVQATVDSGREWPPSLALFKSWCKVSSCAAHRELPKLPGPYAGMTPQERYDHARPFIQTLRERTRRCQRY